MSDAHPSRAELEAQFKDAFWSNPQAQNIVRNIKFDRLPSGFIPRRIGTFVELGEKNLLSGEREIERDRNGAPVTLELTPNFYLRWKDRALKQLAIVFGGDYRQFLNMRKKESFLVVKSVSKKGMLARFLFTLY